VVGEPDKSAFVAELTLTLPEALLLLSHDKFTGRLINARNNLWGRRNHEVALLNRALLAAGLLELILCDRIIPMQSMGETNILLYRLAPDYGSLPTTYVTELWNRLMPHINYDLYYPFERILQLVRTPPQSWNYSNIPDQTQQVAVELRQQGYFDTGRDSFDEGQIPSFFNSENVLSGIKHHLTEAIRLLAINVEPRVQFLLGLLFACDLLRPVFGEHHVLAEVYTRELCRFAHEPETPIGNALTYIQHPEDT
jgi:hypothetical protein